MLEFASQNPLLTVIIVWILAWAVTRPFYYLHLSHAYTIRGKNIAAHGWPTNPYMDADGDIHYPDSDDEEEDEDGEYDAAKH